MQISCLLGYPATYKEFKAKNSTSVSAEEIIFLWLNPRIHKRSPPMPILSQIVLIIIIGTNMFLGCQKIDYHAKHYNIDPKEKRV